MPKNIGAMVLLAGAFLAMAGCSQTTKLGDNAQMTTNATGSEVKITQADGTNTVVTSGGGQYPSAAPVAQYPGSTVTVCQVTSSPSAGQPKLNVIMSSKDPIDKIVDFYKGEITAKGWQIGETIQAPGTMASITAKKGENSNLTVSVTGAPPEGTMISVIEI